MKKRCHLIWLPALWLSGTTLAQNAAVDEYEQSRLRYLQPTAACSDFNPQAGIAVTARDDAGEATAGRIRVLVGNPSSTVYVIGGFNGWGERKTDADRLRPVGNGLYFEGQMRSLRHGMEYRLLVNGEQALDPAASRYTQPPQPLNAVFWDFARPSAYRPRVPAVDLTAAPLVIAEGEVYSMAAKWPSSDGQGPASIADTFRFIAASDLPASLRRSGYNAIEIMPVTQTNDADPWQYRYQTYGLYAIDSRYGTPDDFAQMVDAFNQAGLAVIVDSVLGHVPYDGNSGIRNLSPIGFKRWLRPDGKPFFGFIDSPWGTKRWDFANPEVRNFIADSLTSMVCRYPLGGIRFDNVDGIRYYDGPGGGGIALMQTLAGRIRSYRPRSLLIGEMFSRDVNVMHRLTAWQGEGLGYTNHGDLFEFFRENLQKPADQVDMNALAGALHSAWDIHQAPRIQYLTDHDEAGNVRGGATGSYVATMIGGDRYLQTKKTEAFASLALFSGTAYLDMPQMRLLQQGNFTGNNAVDWSLQEATTPTLDYFTAASTLFRDEPAFALVNANGDFVNHLDSADGKRLISFKRGANGRQVIVLVNLGPQELRNYRFGLDRAGSYELKLDSDDSAFGGTGRLGQAVGRGARVQADSGSFFGRAASVQLPYVGPYATVVLSQ